VARDRQRAKQRKARRARNPGPAPSQPRRENVPGELEHASGEVDEFEAAIVAGADGEPATAEPEAARPEAAEPEPAEAEPAEPPTSAREPAEPDTSTREAAEPAAAAPDAEPLPDDGEGYPQELSDEDFDELEDEIDERLEDDEELEDDRGRPGAPAAAAATPARRPPAAPDQATQKGAGRFAAFLRASWAELQRVQWPDRRQVGQATAVVLGFVVIAGAYLGLADRVASEIVDLII
jgi:preprotein translocase subunit SecE